MKKYPFQLEVLETRANKRLQAEYIAPIKQWLAQLEQLLAAPANMIDLQPEIQWYMRPYLLDFLLELHQLFRLQPQTLFLCVNIVDRYCAKRIVFKRHYQLVGCTALWIAGKYEDKKLRVPTLAELASMCRHAYDEEMFVQMEMHILATLEWLLGHPLLEECLQLAIAALGVLPVTPTKYNRLDLALGLSAVTAVGRFFCELALYDRFFLTVPVSLVAVAANSLACTMLGFPVPLHSLLAPQPRGADENTPPEVSGAFLLGVDLETLPQLRAIAVALYTNAAQALEVLRKKHDALGVIAVVQSFATRHPQLPDDPIYTGDILLGLTRDMPVPLTPPSATQLLVFSHASSAYATPLIGGGPFSPGAWSPK